MGKADQFAKRTFAEETERITAGAVEWQDAPEIGLIKVQGDGFLRVRRPDGLLGLSSPWPEARDHTEVLLELKMPGDHVEWMFDMVQYTPMSPEYRAELRKRFGKTDDPEVLARRREIIRAMLEYDPEARQEIIRAEIEDACLAKARSSLRRVLARRGLVPAGEDEARIDACQDQATLERWLDQAVTASSVAEALQ